MRHPLVLAALFASGMPLPAADWPRFRGPNGTGVSDDKDVPVEWTDQNVLWKVGIPGKGHSSPIVSKGKIFLQTSTAEDKERLLVCLDAGTGATKWTGKAKGGSVKTHAKSNAAACTPAADGERVYALFWDGSDLTLTAWDYDGTGVWTKNLGAFVSQHGPGLSPMVHEGQVILNIDQDGKSAVASFDAKTGDELWRQPRKAYNAAYSTPIIIPDGKKALVVVASTAGVTAYDPAAKGKVAWNYNLTLSGGKGKELRMVGSPVLAGGVVLCYGGENAGTRDMAAVKVGGSGDVTDKNFAWRKNKLTPYVPTVLAAGDHFYWVTDKNYAVCVEAATGEEKWEERIGTGEVSASPVLVNGKVFAFTEKGTVTVFAADPKKYELLAKYDLKEPVFASPAVADGRMYVRGEKNLYCIGTKK